MELPFWFWRALALILFIVTMEGWGHIAHGIVDLGFVPWLVTLAALFAIGFWMDHRSRLGSG